MGYGSAYVLWSQERQRGGGCGPVPDVPIGLEPSLLLPDACLSLPSPYWTLRAWADVSLSFSASAKGALFGSV